MKHTLSALTLLAVLATACAGAKAREEAFRLFGLSAPTIARHLDLGLKEGVKVRQITAAESADLIKTWDAVQAAIKAEDGAALKKTHWQSLRPWVDSGILARVKDQQIGPGVGKMVALETDKFFELLKKVTE